MTGRPTHTRTHALQHACDKTVRRSERPVADRRRMLSEGSMFEQTLIEALRTCQRSEEILSSLKL